MFGRVLTHLWVTSTNKIGLNKTVYLPSPDWPNSGGTDSKYFTESLKTKNNLS